MNLVEHSFDIWGECPSHIVDSLGWIEKAGRVCYNSEDKAGEDTAYKFVQTLCDKGHTSVLEHSNLVVKGSQKDLTFLFSDKKYFKIYGRYVSGNLRAWLDYFGTKSIVDVYDRVKAFGFIEEFVPTDLKRFTIKFVTTRAVTHQLVRHRVLSFSQESQRYVRYNNISYIIPQGIDESSKAILLGSLEQTEKLYLDLLNSGCKPQVARSILTNMTKTVIIVTGYLSDWKDFLKLRKSPGADPEMKVLLNGLNL